MQSSILDRVDEWEKIDLQLCAFYELCVLENFHSEVDLSDFEFRNDKLGFELANSSGSEGYVFVDSKEEDYARAVGNIELIYRKEGKDMRRKFVNRDEGLAGFLWRKK